MFELAQFSQAELLQTVADPVARAGVCVAFCDLWVREIKRHPNATPAERLEKLRVWLPEAMNYQLEYGERREVVGRTVARKEKARTLGINYEEQTTLMRVFLDMGAIRKKLAGDLNGLGAAATWSMRFLDGGGHAIAGFRGLRSLTHNMHEARLHLFDPNIGEYSGQLADLDAMLNDLFNRFPLYQRLVEVHRTAAVP